MSDEDANLKAWIHANMKAEATSELDRWKEDAAKLLSISPGGEIAPRILPNDAESSILLQFIGRAYAEAGGIVESASMSNLEVKAAVSAAPGTVDRVLAELRSRHLLQAFGRGVQRLPASRIGDAIRRVQAKAGK